jgi:D-sedoheptulose 7-phosphate isomerase
MDLLTDAVPVTAMSSDVTHYLAGLKDVLDSLPTDDICSVIAGLHTAREEGRQVFIIGNGGSAATASHMACDLAKTVLGARPQPHLKRFRVMALTDNVPLLTAWSNDESYDKIFSEQLRALAGPGDVLIAITGSGNSANIIEAVNVANDLEMTTIGLLGFDGGALKSLVHWHILVNSDNYGYVEDAHMTLTHIITSHFKQHVH